MNQAEVNQFNGLYQRHLRLFKLMAIKFLPEHRNHPARKADVSVNSISDRNGLFGISQAHLPAQSHRSAKK